MSFSDCFLLFKKKSVCPVCSRGMGSGLLLCPSCRTLLRSASCRTIRCSGRFPLLVAAPYRGPFRHAVLRFKNGGQTHLSPVLAQLMLESFMAFSGKRVNGPELVTWVPGDRRRTAIRGFHPPEMLAGSIARGLQLPAEGLLGRTHADAQTGRSPEERRTRLAGTFRLCSRRSVAGRRILLVDDVVTTGSTFEEAVRVLQRNGAGDVWCLAFAGGEKLFD